MKLFRIQDSEGRGPYRPGFSKQWADKDGPICAPWWIELGISLQAAMAMLPRGMFNGSAFDSLGKLEQWFTPSELEKLGKFNFNIVRFRPDKLIAETPTQVVFAQSYPLAQLPILSPVGGLA